MHTTLLILHFLGLALGVGTGFAQLTLGRAASALPPPERAQFAMRAAALRINGSIGLLLLIVSGIGLVFVRGLAATMAWGGAAFHAKLTLVVVMIFVFGYMQMLARRARLEGGGPALARLPLVGRVMVVLGVAVVICAVLAFQ
jgi:uncharacterized membrane protein